MLEKIKKTVEFLSSKLKKQTKIAMITGTPISLLVGAVGPALDPGW